MGSLIEELAEDLARAEAGHAPDDHPGEGLMDHPALYGWGLAPMVVGA